MNEFLKLLIPVEIVRSPGKETERPRALIRATYQIGKQAYCYLSINCEHFINWVYYGTPKGEQVERLGEDLVVGVTIFDGLHCFPEYFVSNNTF